MRLRLDRVLALSVLLWIEVAGAAPLRAQSATFASLRGASTTSERSGEGSSLVDERESE
jgi:hypothetical protein